MIRARAPCVAAAALLVAGCAGTPAREPAPDVTPPPEPVPAEPAAPASELRDQIALSALSMVGVPYKYGGTTPDEGFDCSGLVYYSYSLNGQVVPRTSREQYDAASKIPLADALAGDLVFFQDEEQLSHVGIYLGDGRFVHAPSRGSSVSIAHMDSPYYQRHFVAVGRLLP